MPLVESILITSGSGYDGQKKKDHDLDGNHCEGTISPAQQSASSSSAAPQIVSKEVKVGSQVALGRKKIMWDREQFLRLRGSCTSLPLDLLNSSRPELKMLLSSHRVHNTKRDVKGNFETSSRRSLGSNPTNYTKPQADVPCPWRRNSSTRLFGCADDNRARRPEIGQASWKPSTAGNIETGDEWLMPSESDVFDLSSVHTDIEEFEVMRQRARREWAQDNMDRADSDTEGVMHELMEDSMKGCTADQSGTNRAGVQTVPPQQVDMEALFTADAVKSQQSPAEEAECKSLEPVETTEDSAGSAETQQTDVFPNKNVSAVGQEWPNSVSGCPADDLNPASQPWVLQDSSEKLHSSKHGSEDSSSERASHEGAVSSTDGLSRETIPTEKSSIWCSGGLGAGVSTQSNESETDWHLREIWNKPIDQANNMHRYDVSASAYMQEGVQPGLPVQNEATGFARGPPHSAQGQPLPESRGSETSDSHAMKVLMQLWNGAGSVNPASSKQRGTTDMLSQPQFAKELSQHLINIQQQQSALHQLQHQLQQQQQQQAQLHHLQKQQQHKVGAPMAHEQSLENAYYRQQQEAATAELLKRELYNQAYKAQMGSLGAAEARHRQMAAHARQRNAANPQNGGLPTHTNQDLATVLWLQANMAHQNQQNDQYMRRPAEDMYRTAHNGVHSNNIQVMQHLQQQQQNIGAVSRDQAVAAALQQQYAGKPVPAQGYNGLDYKGGVNAPHMLRHNQSQVPGQTVPNYANHVVRAMLSPTSNQHAHQYAQVHHAQAHQGFNNSSSVYLDAALAAGLVRSTDPSDAPANFSRFYDPYRPHVRR